MINLRYIMSSVGYLIGNKRYNDVYAFLIWLNVIKT